MKKSTKKSTKKSYVQQMESSNKMMSKMLPLATIAIATLAALAYSGLFN